MNLDEFITDALREIVHGVSAVQRDGVQHGALIGPKTDANGEPMPSPVEFDVAVTTREETSSEAGGGLRVVGFGSAGLKGSSDEGQETVSRIRFTVQLTLPEAR